MKPQRIQLSRRAGFNLHAASRALNGLPAVNCARPGRWGNPYVVQFDPHSDYSPQTAAEAVRMFSAMLKAGKTPPFALANMRVELRGKNLACWCSLFHCPECGRKYDHAGHCCDCDCRDLIPTPCHCDVLLEIANS